MKKLLFVLLFSVTSFVTFGQSKKVLSDASVWFKKYAEATFKDPYSYREVAIKLDSMTNIEYYEPISKSTSLIDVYKKYSETYRILVEEEKSKRNPNTTILKIYQDNYNQHIQDYNKSLEKLNHAKTIMSNMDDKMKQSVHHYIIKLDCYGKNSYGNEILGRYQFKYNVERKEFDIDSVIDLN